MRDTVAEKREIISLLEAGRLRGMCQVDIRSMTKSIGKRYCLPFPTLVYYHKIT